MDKSASSGVIVRSIVLVRVVRVVGVMLGAGSNCCCWLLLVDETEKDSRLADTSVGYVQEVACSVLDVTQCTGGMQDEKAAGWLRSAADDTQLGICYSRSRYCYSSAC
jgi:hypothetical protein